MPLRQRRELGKPQAFPLGKGVESCVCVETHCAFAFGLGDEAVSAPPVRGGDLEVA